MKRAFVTMSALALAASTLTAVTFTVSTVPAFGDHCDPAEQSQTQAQRQQTQDQQDQDQDQDQQGQDQRTQDQDQDQQGQDRQGQDRQDQDPAARDLPPAGGAVNQASPRTRGGALPRGLPHAGARG